MVYWNRFISYIFRYHNYEKCENTGFAKIQKLANQGKIYISMKDMQNRQDGIYSVYLYRETLVETDELVEEEQHTMMPVPVYIGKLQSKGGRCEGEYVFDWMNVMNSGRPLTACCGVIIKRNNSKNDGSEEDMFCSSWTDNVIDYSYAFAREEAEPQAAEDKAPVELLAAVMNNSRIGELFENREKLPLLPSIDIEDEPYNVAVCVKITPNDIGLLHMDNWRLGVNSFLTHGFYNYNYLMLGKITFNDNSGINGYILGVPGEYSSKEQYLARAFGFDRFMPSEETKVKTGSFGYWIVDIKE